jgi:hypothetical protein
MTVARSVDTSCDVPLGPTTNYNPVFITYVQDATQSPSCP